MTPRAHRTSSAALATLVLVATAACAGDPAGPDTDPRTGGAPAASGPGSRGAVDLPPLSRADAPWQVVRQVEASERAIRDPGTDGRTLAAAGRLQQLAYRTLAERTAWDARVADLLAPGLRGAVRDNVAARRAMLDLQREYPANETLPAWRVVDPLPAAELRGYYAEAQREFGVGWEHLAAIHLVETGMGRIEGDSVAGARGPMQFIDETWARYGEGDVTDPRDAILGAGRYLAARGFTAGDDAAIDDAVYAYNNDVRYVRAIRLHAAVMERNPRTYLGYHAWDVVFSTARGDVTLPVGYDSDEPIPVDRWLRDHPQP
ncbi:hypothetical protein GCM10009737_18320 [Nocardioides lentus]|uniref:Lytic transglycosylase domain-containing protein n=1 Tax=Nocardioides lentus TaxID=338077 RepID=A0ABN2PB27_9ACTN